LYTKNLRVAMTKLGGSKPWGGATTNLGAARRQTLGRRDDKPWAARRQTLGGATTNLGGATTTLGGATTTLGGARQES